MSFFIAKKGKVRASCRCDAVIFQDREWKKKKDGNGLCLLFVLMGYSCAFIISPCFAPVRKSS